MALDFFSRQRSVPDWYQPLIERQRALLLGVGGIGCTTAKELCRLGVSELILVDNDTVSASNINRQVLFSVSDVGQSKVEVARRTLDAHNIRTTVSSVNCDAVLEWRRIVELAKKSTVVFNCIDYGEYFDYAVTSLCSSLGLTYVSASSYGHTAIAECYPVVPYPTKGHCWACHKQPADVQVLRKITPKEILQLDSLSFLPKDSNMPTNQDIGSSVLPCTLAATLATGAWINSCHGYTVPNWMSCDFATFQMFSYPSEPDPDCLVCTNAPRYSKQLIDIFFGRERVYLSPVEGETLPYVKDSITSPGSKQHYEEAKKRFKPLTELGKEYTNCVVPAIPAADLEISSANASEKTDLADVPKQLTKPLLKTAEGQLSALRSGGRSCILPTAQACYRLKGCGNFVDTEGMRCPFPGFPLMKHETSEGWVEVRGCCFRHTGLTEQHMSSVVSDVLKEYDIPIGNRPIGLWRYQLNGEPLPRLAKYCGLFETLGEKRVGSHLIPGLESLLPLLFPSVSLDQILGLCPAERLETDAESGCLRMIPTWKACCARSEKIPPIDMCTTPLPETGPSCSSAEGVPADLLEAWCQAAYTLRQSLPLSQENAIRFGSLTALLYWTVGWEMGVVKRALETSGINWGYFFDHNPFEPHCNSHPNNFLVLPPGHASLLAPVDFDLSFQKEHFFSPYTGSHDQDLFDSWLESEHLELERALAGVTVNSGMDMVSSDNLNSSPAHRALGWAFRDTMLLGYRCAYHKSSQGESTNFNPLPPALRTAVDALIMLALIKTVDCVT